MLDKITPAGTERVVPRDITELSVQLEKMAENWVHVDICELRDSGAKLYVDLSDTANFWGNDDFYVPIQPGREAEARALLRRITDKLSRGQIATPPEVRMFWDLIDRRIRE